TAPNGSGDRAGSWRRGRITGCRRCGDARTPAPEMVSASRPGERRATRTERRPPGCREVGVRWLALRFCAHLNVLPATLPEHDHGRCHRHDPQVLEEGLLGDVVQVCRHLLADIIYARV